MGKNNYYDNEQVHLHCNLVSDTWIKKCKKLNQHFDF